MKAYHQQPNIRQHIHIKVKQPTQIMHIQITNNSEYLTRGGRPHASGGADLVDVKREGQPRLDEHPRGVSVARIGGEIDGGLGLAALGPFTEANHLQKP